MIRYVLHGGATRRQTKDNARFFFEVTQGLPESATILCVYFARNRVDWAQLFEQDKINFSSAVPDKNLRFELAQEETNVFVEQIKKTNVIFIPGGSTPILQSHLKHINDLKNLLQNKVVAGSSAGALVFAEYYYENDDDTYNQGLGLLPYKIICHYSEAISGKREQLRKYGKNLEILNIPEEKFLIIEL